MSTQLACPPKPPAQLWGIWTITRKRPEGFWWNHTNGHCENADTPMTFISRDDAIVTASDEWEHEEGGDVASMTVALIGVAPPV